MLLMLPNRLVRSSMVKAEQVYGGVGDVDRDGKWWTGHDTRHPRAHVSHNSASYQSLLEGDGSRVC